MKKRSVLNTLLLGILMLSALLLLSHFRRATDINSEFVSTESPSQIIQMDFWLDNSGRPAYQVTHQGVQVVTPSALGISLANENLRKNLIIAEISQKTVNNNWSPIVGEKSDISDHYNETTITLANKNGIYYGIQIRAYDTGVAIRYLLPSGNYAISEEYTQVSVPLDAKAIVHVKANQTAPKQTQPSLLLESYRLPITFLHANGAAMTICESHVRNFPPLRLRGDSPWLLRFSYRAGEKLSPGVLNDFYQKLHEIAPSLLPGRLRAVFGSGELFDRVHAVATVQSSDPSASPWRTFVIGDSLEQLVENSDIVLNLNDPPEGDYSWVLPGKSFMTWGRGTTEDVRNWIKTAKQQDYQYVLIDSGWYGPEWDERSDPRLDPTALEMDAEWSQALANHIIANGHFKHHGFPMYGRLEESGGMDPDLNIPEIVRFAKLQGIDIILYVEERALFDRLDRYSVDELFARFKEWGVAGVKPGFVKVDSQDDQRRLERMVESAAKHHLVLVIHDEWLSYGLERTYPNILSTEAILGDEELKTEQIPDDITALFTRLIQGPADHTFIYPGKGTKGYALASPILFRSGFQSLFWFSSPYDVASQPQAEIKLWRDLPVVWDQLLVLEASLYEYATYARRKDREWYVGSLSAISRELNLTLHFLDESVTYRAEIYADAPGVDGRQAASMNGKQEERSSEKVLLETIYVDNTTVLRKHMEFGTGYAVRLSPAKQVDLEAFERLESNRNPAPRTQEVFRGETCVHLSRNSGRAPAILRPGKAARSGGFDCRLGHR